MIPKLARTPKCKCGKALSGARVVIEGRWVCPDCAYKHDHPDKEIVEKPRTRPAKKQSETLFPTPPQKPRGSDG